MCEEGMCKSVLEAETDVLKASLAVRGTWYGQYNYGQHMSRTRSERSKQ